MEEEQRGYRSIIGGPHAFHSREVFSHLAAVRPRELGAMTSNRNRVIAEALAAPPPEPPDCPLRSLELGAQDGLPLLLRVPVANHINTMHIRAAHDVATLCAGETSHYHAALQAEYSRLQDSQPWYWDQLWPGGVALARRILEEPNLVRGRSVLEFGSGIGLLACACARAGAACVVATDIEPAALAFAAQSALDNSLASSLHTVVWDWDASPPAEVEARAPFDVVLLPDVMYDDAAVERLGVLAPSLVAPGGLLLWADGTDRVYGEGHTDRLAELVLAASPPRFEIRTRVDLRAGASAADGGAAPDRPVRLVVAARGGDELRHGHLAEAERARASTAATPPGPAGAGHAPRVPPNGEPHDRERDHGVSRLLRLSVDPALGLSAWSFV